MLLIGISLVLIASLIGRQPFCPCTVVCQRNVLLRRSTAEVQFDLHHDLPGLEQKWDMTHQIICAFTAWTQPKPAGLWITITECFCFSGGSYNQLRRLLGLDEVGTGQDPYQSTLLSVVSWAQLLVFCHHQLQTAVVSAKSYNLKCTDINADHFS